MKIKKILKYTYLITVTSFYLLVMLLNQVDKDFNNSLNNFENKIITYFRDDIDRLYVLVVLLGIVILNGLGIKDIFGFTNFFIIMVTKFLHHNEKIQIIISVIISGFFNGLEKFIRYYYFSLELQNILSKPFDVVLFLFRKLFEITPFLKRKNLSFLTTKYLLIISKKTKTDKKYNIIYNYRNKFTRYKIFNNFLTYVISTFWLAFSEWITGFKELLLFVHNWDFNYKNIMVLIFSEFLDADNIIEIILMVNAFNDGGIMETKMLMIVVNTGFTIIGYILFFIPTLYWLRKYYYSEFHVDKNGQEGIIIEMDINIRDH